VADVVRGSQRPRREAQLEASNSRLNFSKVLCIVALHNEYTRALIFENLCQGVRSMLQLQPKALKTKPKP
jgi:hypothetical protein